MGLKAHLLLSQQAGTDPRHLPMLCPRRFGYRVNAMHSTLNATHQRDPTQKADEL
jgi:hypothetical protein